MSEQSRFLTKRESGLTDTEVVLSLLDGKPPGHIITYEQLENALSAGTNRSYSRMEAQSSVNAAKHAVLTRMKRCLRAVTNVGYRVCASNEHVSLAAHHGKKAVRQHRKALRCLDHVNESEMTPAEIERHRLQQTVNHAVFGQLQLHSKKLRRHEKAIEDVRRRLAEMQGDGLLSGTVMRGTRSFEED